GGTKTLIVLFVTKGFSSRHIIKLACVLFKILSDFSPTIFSTKLFARGQPNTKQSASISRDERLIPLAILKSTVVTKSTSVSAPAAYFAVLSKFCRAKTRFFSACASLCTTLRIFKGWGDFFDLINVAKSRIASILL